MERFDGSMEGYADSDVGGKARGEVLLLGGGGGIIPPFPSGE